MPCPIVSIVKMDSGRGDSQNILVALKNGDIKMYNQKNLIDTCKTDD
jgi:hypothetical protein